MEIGREDFGVRSEGGPEEQKGKTLKSSDDFHHVCAEFA